MLIDCLSVCPSLSCEISHLIFHQQQSAGAAWPHILGILSGHIYHFFHDVWPKLGGKQRFVTPKLLIKRFGGTPRSNVPGFMEARKAIKIPKAKANSKARSLM